MYLRGITGLLWSLINDLNVGATTVVAWDGTVSPPFQINQGVRQGGVLSTECCTIYWDTLLDRLQENQLEKVIGNIYAAAPTCDDDIALIAHPPYDLQLMINVALDYNKIEQYKLQPTKSVVLEILPSYFSEEIRSTHSWELDGEVMPVVQKAAHLGITRSVKDQTSISIQDNVSKGRRTTCFLMASGLIGVNGLDPAAACTILQTFVVQS
jgi:hypothetical protein